MFLPVLLVQTIGNGSSCGLVDDAKHLKTGDHSRILRGLRGNYEF